MAPWKLTFSACENLSETMSWARAWLAHAPRVTNASAAIDNTRFRFALIMRFPSRSLSMGVLGLAPQSGKAESASQNCQYAELHDSRRTRWKSLLCVLPSTETKGESQAGLVLYVRAPNARCHCVAPSLDKCVRIHCSPIFARSSRKRESSSRPLIPTQYLPNMASCGSRVS